MATQPHPSLPGHPAEGRPASTAPQHFVPPTARELRAQAMHRLQVGLLGLAAMLLLVGLASIIMERARLAENAMATPAGLTSPTTSAKSDPLADIGVIPSPDSARQPSGAPTN